VDRVLLAYPEEQRWGSFEKSEGKYKGKGQPRTGHEGPEWK